MPLDVPLVTLGDINRGEWPEQFGKRPGTIFSYVMNNYWDTNYRARQGGHFRFHYVVTNAPSTNAQELSHTGWEGITPWKQTSLQPRIRRLARNWVPRKVVIRDTRMLQHRLSYCIWLDLSVPKQIALST